MSKNRLQLEFAPEARHTSKLGVAMLVGCAILLGATVLQFGQVLAGNARQQDTLAALQAHRDAGSKNRTAPADPGAIARARTVRRVTQNLTTPWADMLESLESAPNQSVALLSVEPSAAKRSIRITAEARGTQDMLDYVGALQRDSHLSRAILVSHQLQEKAPGTPVRFQIQADWGSGQ
jgi:Tfp pilus assembly protein PilN